jgi:hypothetical protein
LDLVDYNSFFNLVQAVKSNLPTPDKLKTFSLSLKYTLQISGRLQSGDGMVLQHQRIIGVHGVQFVVIANMLFK